MSHINQNRAELAAIASSLGSVEIKPHWAAEARQRAEDERKAREGQAPGVQVMGGKPLSVAFGWERAEDTMATKAAEAVERGRVQIEGGRPMSGIVSR